MIVCVHRNMCTHSHAHMERKKGTKRDAIYAWFSRSIILPWAGFVWLTSFQLLRACCTCASTFSNSKVLGILFVPFRMMMIHCRICVALCVKCSCDCIWLDCFVLYYFITAVCFCKRGCYRVPYLYAHCSLEQPQMLQGTQQCCVCGYVNVDVYVPWSLILLYFYEDYLWLCLLLMRGKKCHKSINNSTHDILCFNHSNYLSFSIIIAGKFHKINPSEIRLIGIIADQMWF